MRDKNLDELAEKALWYVVTVKSGTEDATRKTIFEKVKSFRHHDKVFDVKIIKEHHVEIKDVELDDAPGTIRNMKNIKWESIKNKDDQVIRYRRTKTVDRNMFPGYIFIKMIMSEQVWFMIRNTTNVTGIIGSSGKNVKPSPISGSEMEILLNTTERMKGEQLTTEQTEKGITDIIVQEDAVIVEKKEYVCNFSVGNKVLIRMNDSDDDDELEEGIVKKIDTSKGLAVVEIVYFGRAQDVEVKFDQVIEN